MSNPLKLTLPKGRIQEKVMVLLGQVGLNFTFSTRSYRPKCSDPTIETKVLKPQNIPALVALGRHDCGFTGLDWVTEQQFDQHDNLVELMDLGFDPVQIVAAMPEDLVPADGNFPKGTPEKPLIVASEYRNLTHSFIKKHNLNAVFVQTYGATEALPPEDADMIVDNTATGSTLRLNRLQIVDEVMRSTTRFVANRKALEDPVKKQKLDELCMLMKSSLNARERVMLEMNIPKDQFDALIKKLPAMRSPTVSPLHGEEGFAVKIAVPAKETLTLIPELVQLGARDILEYRLEKIVY